MEKQLKSRQFGTILSINKTTGKTSIETAVSIEVGCAAPKRGQSPGAIFARRFAAHKIAYWYQKSGACPDF
ncbi:hypothetical protein [Agathobaculum sp.]|uniref:hypothetical protein n=1 Tax=Agathobaculum sp. TaxID=2048138 RepID=UPI001F9A17A0|nr:hypothetical protein [Candidatus Agathobaculum intestinigallinarum]